MNRVPCSCTEEEAEPGFKRTLQCLFCNALEVLQITRSDIENLSLLKECNQALAERGVRLQKKAEIAQDKEREARRASRVALDQRRDAIYALRGAGIDEDKARLFSQHYLKENP